MAPSLSADERLVVEGDAALDDRGLGDGRGFLRSHLESPNDDTSVVGAD